MRYDILLKILRVLMYVKRLFWWTGARINFVLVRFAAAAWRIVGYANYKTAYFFKKLGLGRTGAWIVKRDHLQIFVFLTLLFAVIPQTKLYARKIDYLPGQRTIAYRLSSPDEEGYSVEEIAALAEPAESVSLWRQGALMSERMVGSEADVGWREQELAGIVAGGSAISKPFIMPGAVLGGQRDKTVEYIVEPGDSLSGIAYKFGISVPTILWENKLSLNAILRPGDKLKILPATGVTHQIKKGDNLRKIASLYEAKTEDIIKFNKLKEDGSDLIIGERIVVPGGIKPQERRIASVPRTYTPFSRGAAPPSSSQVPSTRGFVWPAAAKTITQYYNWRHHAIDIAGGGRGTPIFAAKAGTVMVSQCGWNNGYGCYIMIDHGGGVRTLYAHHSQLLVGAGENVGAGQTIALMGRTGKVRGVTGIHLHFEIIINGVRVNPLGYVR